MNIPKVQVLMSTYNGEQYLEKQVESIISQKNVITTLLIRDDGSTDGTVNQIKKMKQKYPNRIQFYQGENLGYKKSFLDLTHKASNSYDYYAFSDQDDYWLPNKLERAVNVLGKSNNKIKLYASTVLIADKNLKILYKKSISNYVNTLGSSLCRIRLAGCTYVFNRYALSLLKDFNFKNISKEQMPSHDGLLITLCQALNGYVYIDQKSYILHRRSSKSVTSGGNGITKRLKVEKGMIFNHKNEKLELAKYIKNHYSVEISNKNMELINLILQYQLSIRRKLHLLKEKQLDCGILLANLETKFQILLNLY